MSAVRALDLDITKRDDRRYLAGRLSWCQKFVERATAISYDADGGSMVIHGSNDGSFVCSLAVPSWPDIRTKPLWDGQGVGLWHACTGIAPGKLNLLALDPQAAYQGFQVGADTSLVVVDPVSAPSMTRKNWVDAARRGLAEEVCRLHGSAPCLAITSTVPNLISAELHGLGYGIHEAGYSAPIVFMPSGVVEAALRCPEASRKKRYRDLSSLLTSLCLTALLPHSLRA